MKKFFTLLLMASCAVGIKAQGTYALAVDEAPKSGDQITSVANITMTYGEAGGADWKAAVADTHIDGGAVFGAYTAGNGTNGNKAGGTWVTLQPVYDGTIVVGVVINADKAFYVEEDGTALADFNGKTYTEKYYGVETFSVAAGKSYKVYVSGSKMGFYGFTYECEVPETGYGFDGEGTETNPYLLRTAADFETLAAKIDADNTGAGEYFALAGDIDFAGAGLPMIASGAIVNVNTVNYGFEGVINGGGYTISGVKHEQPNKDDANSSYVGIVSSLGENGVIKNLTVMGEINAYMYVGVFAGLTKGTIENCVNYANITNTGAFAGGIAGGFIRGLGTIDNCENYGNITATGTGSYPTGIVGSAQKKSDIEAYNYVVKNSNNFGSITSGSAGAAGIAGNFIGTIYNCNNEGDVTAEGSQYVGGIAACCADVLTIKKCCNFGKVTGGSKVGGIAGELRHATAVIDGCYNVSDIEDGVLVGGGITAAHSDASKIKNIGGIVGNSTKAGAAIKHCASITAVSAEGVETAGHLIGNADIVVEDCYFYAPDAALPLDDATLALEAVEDLVDIWSETFKGTMVVNTMGQTFEFTDQEIQVVFLTTDEATITIPEIVYGSYVIEEFGVDVPYTASENGYTFSCGEYTAQAGQFDIAGNSVEGVQTGDDIALTTVFTAGRMPMPMTVTFNGTKVEDITTAIETVEAPKAEAGAKYDLQGRRTNGEAGLFIENGKIFIVR